MYQLDFIKLKLKKVENINMEFLAPHPTIRDRYRLDIPQNKFKGRSYFGENIDIYISKDSYYLSTSLPYLRFGHNFTEFTASDVEQTISDLSEMLKVDLFESKVLIREFAVLRKSKLPFRQLESVIAGVKGMTLRKKSPSFLLFGKTEIQCKIYEVKPNLLKKIHPSVRNEFGLDKLNEIVKTELRFLKTYSENVSEYLKVGMLKDIEFLEEFIKKNITICPFRLGGNSFADILLEALLNIGSTYCSVDVVYSQILKQIDLAELTSSQKSARRKTLFEKLNNVSSEHGILFSDFFEPMEDLNSLSGIFPKDNSLISKS
ncbi:hypothetical protein [Gillisia sp. JM1]|uniref:hypothetical protein n=1 Tax=Gillisia sp. JM1 TaxID=1283286 RepID=UPI0012DEF588|nr:hypothetical protein [Gillisia sp. JM1]